MTKTQAVTNLVALEERCGPLCHFDKPVKIDEGEFMGHVTAKVVFLSLLDQKFFSHFMTRSFSLTSRPEHAPKVNCSSLFTLEDVTPAPGKKLHEVTIVRI